jgi:hypothetical protein
MESEAYRAGTLSLWPSHLRGKSCVCAPPRIDDGWSGGCYTPIRVLAGKLLRGTPAGIPRAKLCSASQCSQADLVAVSCTLSGLPKTDPMGLSCSGSLY